MAAHPVKSPLTWKSASEWVLSRSIAPARLAPRQAWAMLATLLLLIGVADYVSGIRVSMSVFYFVPVLLSTAWFGWRLGLGVAATSIVVRVTADLLANELHALPISSWWNVFTGSLVYCFLVWVFSNLLTMRRQLEQRIEERTAELVKSLEHRRDLEHELITVSATERNSMGQELHDDVCQHLVATSLAAKVLAQRLTQEKSALAVEAQTIIAMLETANGKARQLARGLLLSAIEPTQLAEKLGELAEEGSRTGVPCRFRQAGDVQVADADTAAQFYRIAQEAMRNAIRHGAPERVDISLVGDGQAICLMVEDNGRGLSESEPRSGMGLPIMSHRAAYIGATLSKVSQPGQGTRVVCHLPREAETL